MTGNTRQRLRGLFGKIAGLLPEGFWLGLTRLVWISVYSQEPRKALKILLTIDSRLGLYIDEAAINYEGGVHPKHRLTGYHDFFLNRLQQKERVLDVGCGTGAVAHDLAVRGNVSVVGLDHSENNILHARRMHAHPRVTYVQGDAVRDLPEEKFDVVILSNVLEHLPHRVDFLKGLVTSVQPSRILLRIPLMERHWSVPMRMELGLDWRCDDTHETEYTVESFCEEMHSAGLRVVFQELRWGEIWAEAAPEPKQTIKAP